MKSLKLFKHGQPLSPPPARPHAAPQLTQLHLLERGIRVISRPLSGILAAGHVAGDLSLRCAQVHQQGGDLGLEL